LIKYVSIFVNKSSTIYKIIKKDASKIDEAREMALAYLEENL